MVRWCALLLVPLAIACGSSESDSGQTLPGGGTGGGMTMGGGGGLGGLPPTGGGSGFMEEAPTLEADVKKQPTGSSTGLAFCPAEFIGSTELDFAVADARGMASGPRVRELVSAGQLGPAAIRSQEINNYFRLSWPTTGEQTGFHTLVGLRPRKVEGAALPGHYDLLVALRADPTVHLRQKVKMVVVVDTSPWMSDEGLSRARDVVRALANSMQPGDYFGLKSVAGAVLFDSVLSDPAAELADVEAPLAREDGGSVRSAVEGALTKLQEGSADPAVWNRVVYVGNGGASADSGPDLQTVRNAATSPHQVFVSTVGVGLQNYNGGLLAGLARAGRGAHLYIDTPEEPSKLIQARFVELFGMAADEVRIKVNLPWFVRSLDPLPPPDSSDPAAPPQYLSPGGTMLHVFRLFVCEDALANASEQIGIGFSYKLPADTSPQSYALTPLKVTTSPSADASKLDEIDAIDAWVSAFRAPSSTRYDLAKSLLAANTLTGAPFDELRDLLTKHPNAPLPPD